MKIDANGPEDVRISTLEKVTRAVSVREIKERLQKSQNEAAPIMRQLSDNERKKSTSCEMRPLKFSASDGDEDEDEEESRLSSQKKCNSCSETESDSSGVQSSSSSSLVRPVSVVCVLDMAQKFEMTSSPCRPPRKKDQQGQNRRWLSGGSSSGCPNSDDEEEPPQLLEACAAPLPPGPPPKKPPRTFEHDLYLKSKIARSSNGDDPKPGVRGRPRSPPPSPPGTRNEEDKLSSLPYVEVGSPSESSFLKRCRSEEHIYAVPYADPKSPLSKGRLQQSYSQIGDGKVVSPIYAEIRDGHVSSAKKELHYSCVPVFPPRNKVNVGDGVVVIVSGSGNPESTKDKENGNGNGETGAVIGRPVCKKTSLKRRPPVNSNKSWARRCLELSRANNNCGEGPDPKSRDFRPRFASASSVVKIQVRSEHSSPAVALVPSSSSPNMNGNWARCIKRNDSENEGGSGGANGGVGGGGKPELMRRPPLPSPRTQPPPAPVFPAARDKGLGLNLSIQSLVEKARRKVTPSKPALPARNGAAATSTGLKSSSDTSLASVNGGGEDGERTTAAGDPTRTASSSSSGTEDSDLTNEEEDEEEEEEEEEEGSDREGRKGGQGLTFSELKERWKEREKVVERRKNYVRRVSRTVSSVYRRTLLAGGVNRLFDCVLVVGLYHDSRRDQYKPFVKRSFPPDASYPENIAMFCFPDACNWRGGRAGGGWGGEFRRDSACNSYSIVLTSEKGERTFGYCRRIVPEGQDECIPLAYCLLSKIRAHGFYDKFMSVLIGWHGCPDAQMQTFLSLVSRKPMPAPGQSLALPNIPSINRSGTPSPPASPSSPSPPSPSRSPSRSRSSSSFSETPATVSRALDERLEESDLSVLVETLGFAVLMKVYGAVLLERKILLASSSMKKLSSCIQGLASLLYPFSWEHVLVPILPITLKDVVTAPSPFLIGLLLPTTSQSSNDFARDLFSSPEFNSEGLLVVDVDKRRLVKSVGDESTIIPRKILKCLQSALALVQEVTDPGDPARNVLVSEMFISVFVELCGHYKNHIVLGSDGKRVFQSDTFLAAVKKPSYKNFLAWFIETAMFSIFIDNRILSNNNGSRENDLFDYRVMERLSDGGGKNIFKTMKQFGKTVKTLSDKWRDWKAHTIAHHA